MKLLVVIVDHQRLEDLLAVLRRSGITGYSVVPSVFGAGETGRHLGTRAFPGENTMVFALVSKLEFEGLRAELQRFGEGLGAGEAFKVMGLDAEALT
jgi:hypothetical protein